MNSGVAICARARAAAPGAPVALHCAPLEGDGDGDGAGDDDGDGSDAIAGRNRDDGCAQEEEEEVVEEEDEEEGDEEATLVLLLMFMLVFLVGVGSGDHGAMPLGDAAFMPSVKARRSGAIIVRMEEDEEEKEDEEAWGIPAPSGTTAEARDVLEWCES